jgi:hypothetical protein
MDQEKPMAPKDLPAADEPYFVSRTITLNRQEVIEALTAAVLARAGGVARFGPPRLRNMTVDAQVTDGTADIAGVVASVEAPLDPAVVAALEATQASVGRDSGERERERR